MREIKLFIVLCVFAGCSLTGIRHSELPNDISYSHAEAAEKLRKRGKYQAAIEEYQKHIQARLENTDKEKDENPYFYYLLIGESYLRMEKLDKAEESYRQALEKSVNVTLVADGFRQIAQTYERRGDYDAAIDILRKHRELDDLLYDAQIDRIHKKSVYEAEKSE
jgi:tetratricopeptide (TPR) repeat protein